MRRLYLLVLILLMAGCEQQAIKADKSALPETKPAAEPASRADSDTQLKINQEALLRGATDEVRLDAAMVMLFSDSTRSRQVLIDTLKQAENKQAKIAVCRALSVSRETRREVKNKKEFIIPLAEILRYEDSSLAKYAADAMLIYDYDEISSVLESMAKDDGLSVRARTNAMYALKMQLDIRAIITLTSLVDDKNEQVSSAAEQTLRSIGIPISKYARNRSQIIAELRSRGMERFQRELMVRQESRVGELEKERDLWRKMYLASLNRIYDMFGDEGQRGKFLTEQLGNSEASVRLWALDKVSQWRVGTQAKLPAEMGPVLMKLVSDGNRDVRLATAKLLSLTGELGSPERLAEQLAVEQDVDVRLELFTALGAACHYALVPTSGSQLSPELRKQTLEWAVAYLNDNDAKKAYRGAEVIRKMLEPGGLEPEDAARYMDLLVERYKLGGNTGDGTFRGELLGIMARLCSQNLYKGDSAKKFAPLFEQALADDAELVREAAVDGLVCVDKPKALKLLSKDFANDRSQIVRNKIIELAADVGGKDDLVWLWEKVGANSESKPAWQAMLKIFNGCDVNVIESWSGRFDLSQNREKVSDEQMIAFFELAERRAITENRPEMVRNFRERLARLYIKTGQFEQATERLGKMRESAQTTAQKDEVLGLLMDVYLRWPRVEAASRLVGNCLLERDLDNYNPVVRSIEAYLGNPTGVADPNTVLESLRKIKSSEQRPKWEQKIEQWNARFGQTRQGGNPPAGGG
jgi:HEAT repeat protein